ncbi:MAG: AAA family ATPase [Candidatus Nomurabacteria bacterium]|nr:AAA family ATPase [Candidatus Nomurabacteria bacterium]
MTLKSIELIGFKSFGKKSPLSFSTPITCIVGPNGSGKSNIVEAIRFVLGEQSMKSLRGKGGVDLIFKGSKNLSTSNRASVIITFDNSQKIFSFTNSGIGVSLDYDEVTIGREVFTDGANRYLINGTEVRLKDVVDLLASVNIGSTGHHIISQGEADRVLNASNKDRRSMIEDALGLKIYQYRIKESERKLDKTVLNMKEVQMLRREIAPHLSFLKKQVEKVEKARSLREDLRNLYKIYLGNESTYINSEGARINSLRLELDKKALSIDEKINGLEKEKNGNSIESENIKIIKEKESNLSGLRGKRDELARSLGRMEGIIEGIERQYSKIRDVKERIIKESEWKSLVEDLESKIDEAINFEDLESVKGILKNIKEKLGLFLHHGMDSEAELPKIEDNAEYLEMCKAKENIIGEISQVKIEEGNILNAINELKAKEQESQSVLRDNERVYYELLSNRNEVSSSLHSLSFEEEKLAAIKTNFEMELAEGGAIIGREVIDFAKIKIEEEIVRSTQEEIRRKIERIKIKLEDSGSGGDATSITKEYDETVERDTFLGRELEDLNKSIESLHTLIEELKETLDKEFKEGVDKINKQFQEFFALMFGGGSASLSITMEYKKVRKDDEIVSEEDMEDDEEEEEEVATDESNQEFERGIEINVNLPHKKVKDLHMLSGGERSLTSIALLFAVSQVNPPPFLVLDETDAALDEANSRKYGDMLLNLSKYSQLIVVTHNRETMSRAQVLYGVTMSSEGASKLLSIHLEDASVYAK